ncbi:MAG: caspase family protein [Elusimicrobiota bacterium]|nr:MAG: caspase family protein [Elusimicrobiota bacterium]
MAIVVGVERTRQGLPRADYAARDAKVFADYLVETLGYPKNNVALLLDERAAKSDLDKYVEDWLPRKAGRDSTVVVFFSGHGAPDPVKGTTYLVPYDGDPAFLDKTAYPLKRLYEQLGRLKARRSIVLLDACFSGAGPRSALAKGARPLVARQTPVEPPANLAVLSAAASNQIGGAFDAQGHGLFTYFVLKSLRDAAAKGRAPTMQELFDDVSTNVEAEARRLTGNEQTPQLQAAPEARASSL